MIILNDIHLGANRRAGTTANTAAALKEYLQLGFARLVEEARGDHLCIAGDLFDSFTVEAGDVIRAYQTLAAHLESGGALTLIAGNHDFSPRGNATSSFHMLAHFLQSRYPEDVEVIDHTTGLAQVSDGIWAIGHMPNQALFELELDKVMQQDAGYLILHCNVMSPFAEVADHSLNLSESQLDALISAGWNLLVAHEHAPRNLKAGRCIVIGNQIPSSISDCLNNKGNFKDYLVVGANGIARRSALDLQGVYADIDWQHLDDVDPNLVFIRVSGEASVAESSTVIDMIARLRASHSALIISNAVSVEGMSNSMEMASLETVQAFDVLSALLELLSEEEANTVKRLLEEESC